MTPEERDAALELVEETQRARSGDRLAGFAPTDVPTILLPYQVRWHLDTSTVRICDKGRRVGFTWGAWAPEATGEAALASGGMDQFYMGYNQGMAAEFIGDCARFARFFQQACSAIDVRYEGVIIDDEKHDVVTYRIKFASGNKVEALSAMPHNWRGRQGHARIDEAGHHTRLAAVIDGALAYSTWGGRISIGGTHNGEDNPFNDYVKRAIEKKLPWSHHRVRFSDAIAEGLFRRICLVTRKPWTPEGERAFVAGERAKYAATDVADEELECIPRRGTGVYFSRLLLEKCAIEGPVVLRFAAKATFVLDPERERVTQRWIDETLAPVVRALPKNRRTVAGQDFGRSGDLSIIVVAQKHDAGHGWDTPLRVELRNIPFDCQKQITLWLLQELPLFHHAKFDARGNGQSHAEAAMQKFGAQRVECVQLTGGWYNDQFPRYHQAYEDGEISTFGDEDWIADHRSVVLVGGVPRVSDARTKGSDGGDRHGDAAVAGVLAWAATRQEAQPAAGATVESTRADTLPERMLGRRRSQMFGRPEPGARRPGR